MAKQRVLFIDRDGTIIKEPPIDFQVDSLEKLDFVPYAISALQKIALSGRYKLVMVTNQDGLGTDSYPEDTFWPAQNKMLDTLKGEGIVFDQIMIDKTFEHENAPTRKPRTGLLAEYINNSAYDLDNSYVIGDRKTDVELAKNLKCKSIFIAEEKYKEATLTSFDWNEIGAFLLKDARTAFVHRKTKETDIQISVNLDGSGKTDISTGLNFFDHMLDQIGKHSGTDLTIKVDGDLHIDEHHTIEDTALALGEAFIQALGNKRGIMRYGFLLPMDDCLSQVAIDFGGRPWIEWDVSFKREKVGDMPTEMVYHFFKSFSDTSKCNLNVKAEGDNEHHKIESMFKALAKAIKMAIKQDVDNNDIPSTKGTL
ncbi:MAG: bifunctional histidinol-phosphatase/imidazoleglycerol-phosphate dehydratase HisB [Cyclobacteriaceae bacterium]